MVGIIKAIGIIFILVSVTFFLKPAYLKNVMRFFKKDQRLYLAGVIRIVIAVILLLGAGRCHMSRMIAALGILFLISGLLVFIIKPAKFKSVMEWTLKQPVWIIRTFAGFILFLGLLIIYSA